MVAGPEGYAAFAPPGWAAPPAAHEADHLRGVLGDAQVWCLLAAADGALVGQVAILPAPRAARRVDDPALVRLRNLFARRDF